MTDCIHACYSYFINLVSSKSCLAGFSASKANYNETEVITFQVPDCCYYFPSFVQIEGKLEEDGAGKQFVNVHLS
jgi:hypothetical protein